MPRREVDSSISLDFAREICKNRLERTLTSPMLLRFRVSNFRSLRDEQELSMIASTRGGGGAHLESLGLDVLRVAAVYGANAAGKSNVLAALRLSPEDVVH